RRRRQPSAESGGRCVSKSTSTIQGQLRVTKNPATACSAGIAPIMTTAAMPCALKNRSVRNHGGDRAVTAKKSDLQARIGFHGDIADRAVAIRFVPGYDNLCFA